MKTIAFAFAAALLLASPAFHAASGERCSSKFVAGNIATVKIVFDEILSKGRIDENEHIYHRDFVAHGRTRDAFRAEDRAASEGWRKAFPDLKVSVLRTVADCDHVAVHFEGVGTNSGEGNGLPATGRSITVRGMTIFHLKDGKIFEEWTELDQYDLLSQLGLVGAD